ncbi:tubulin folding cofactor D C terminal-domain-containing protein [Lineolata rhizophorae]|uniref:Tubulin folding cofactor D C terminal-domain-containing protein n=1 Tax=Lineolata rhizophorae TaxID=578093 RepID=A0A6A6P5Z1_9PEZI|nr:tubulin folding cofactor D C terminal-domain-containing protein [Lineolata rhizophorae]
MNPTTEDDDLLLQRASANLLAELRTRIDKVLWKKASASRDVARTPHRYVKERDLWRTLALLDPFQGDPQLLDTHLKFLLPPLVDAYLQTALSKEHIDSTKPFVPLPRAVCCILNSFCKVRGEKIIIGFLNNEPRHLEPILSAFERGTVENRDSTKRTKNPGLVWEERYILLLWLSHLLLVPFDLASISAPAQQCASLPEDLTGLPKDLPGIPIRILPIVLLSLRSATKERFAAAKLLVKLCLRPDMRAAGLLDCLTNWALASVKASETKSVHIHKNIGLLSFLSGLVSSGTVEEIGKYLAPIYHTCAALPEEVSSSAVARKLVIKTYREIANHSLQPRVDFPDLEGVMEEIIESLLQSVGDGDTPVRYAASKALSVISLKLQQDMAEEVIEAILGYLNENVLWEGNIRDLRAVDPLQWHGLMLTLGHLLYRRAVPNSQLPAVLNSLILGLNFEQRGTTGGSIGTNVRDAACFGIWSLSRRYTTKELDSVDTREVHSVNDVGETQSILRALAVELLVAACLDPVGNIRRGSSAALQELVGRHPDVVDHGISLVQVVDFHAVGLRDRALGDVALASGRLSPLYRRALFSGLMGWRGIGALDAASRTVAAKSIGKLSMFDNFEHVDTCSGAIQTSLAETPKRDVEKRHGIVLALTYLVEECVESSMTDSKAIRATCSLTQLWQLFDGPLALKEENFTSVSLRPEVTAISILSLISALAELSLFVIQSSSSAVAQWNPRVMQTLDYCLRRTEDSVHSAIPSCVQRLGLLLPKEERRSISKSWMDTFTYGSKISSRPSGHAIALGAIYCTIENAAQRDHTAILDALASRCSDIVAIEARVVAVKSIQLTFPAIKLDEPKLISKVAEALVTGLNDYTINQRGDVGSLVRLEAITGVSNAWKQGLLSHGFDSAGTEQDIFAAMLRLSVEKLDKVRNQAGQCLDELESTSVNPSTFSSFGYFRHRLSSVFEPPIKPRWARRGVLAGYVTAAGMGSESVLQASRLALVDLLETMPAEYSHPDDGSILDVANILTELLRDNLGTDRVVLPLLEVIAFLFDAGFLQKLVGTEFK